MAMFTIFMIFIIITVISTILIPWLYHIYTFEDSKVVQINRMTMETGSKHSLEIVPSAVVAEDIGFERKTAVISGMVRDAEPDLLGLLVQIEKLACHWNDYDIVILTNNNEDNTSLLLEAWSKRPIHCDQKEMNLAIREKPFYSKKYIISYNDTELPPGLSREDRFVYYRNSILDYVMNQLLNYKRSEYFRDDRFVYDSWIMLDFDIQGLEQSRIFQEFSIASQQFNVDVFCVNGMEWTGRYRDTFATVFYDGEWCFDDNHQCSRIIQQHRFLKVRSCFGGLTIYKFGIIYESQCKYQTKDELKDNAKYTHQWFQKQDPKWKKLCEHIAFNDCIHNHYYDDDDDDDENFKLIISRDSYLYYGFKPFQKWQEEGFLFGSANR